MPIYVIKVGKTLDLIHKKNIWYHGEHCVQADLFEEDRIKKLLTLNHNEI